MHTIAAADQVADAASRNIAQFTLQLRHALQ
jgi:hypothetical protein